ncbi:hypothetical protein [Streptomyces sp. ALI-76-A]|uniref:hypothetical protein n=1 Tax=Streptomyces sp. ALI-76-A TaxID=3025736 RepID=UPI00256EAB7C|nr:hypothetical protein [Streptomyces sp. ALI-76-A]MDL5205168.1 hypothetical protein [Streptomyces sp. ALI-76-A]
MRAIRVASAALLGVCALALTSPAAHARAESTGFRVGVLPQTVAAGGQVTLRATGCHQDVFVSSGVFDDVTIRKGRTTATATVDRDAKPGALYEVTFHCGTFWQNAGLTIAGGRPVEPAPVPVRPSRGVHAGEGGSSAGFDLQETGLGIALIAGSVGTAYHLSRRHAEEDGD